MRSKNYTFFWKIICFMNWMTNFLNNFILHSIKWKKGKTQENCDLRVESEKFKEFVALPPKKEVKYIYKTHTNLSVNWIYSKLFKRPYICDFRILTKITNTWNNWKPKQLLINSKYVAPLRKQNEKLLFFL